MSSEWKDWHLRKEGTLEPEIKKLEELLKKSGGTRILDVGCGTGRHAIHFAKRGFEVQGFDNTEDSVERAKQLLKAENLIAELRIWDMSKPFPYENNFFDAVIASRVIHHTTSSIIERIVSEISRVLKEEGLLFLQVPSYESEIFDSGTIWAEPGTLIARGGPEKGVLHHFFKRDELLKLFAGYAVEEIHGKSDHYGGYCLIARKEGHVDLWSFESQVYPRIDAAGMRAKQKVEEKFILGEGNMVDVKIQTLDGKPLSNSRKVEVKNLLFSINFRSLHERQWKQWFRVDSEYKYLHFHLETPTQKFSEHIELSEDETIGELVSYAFEEAKKYLQSKGVRVSEGEGFGGFA